jgi:hypothetical protein
MRMETTLKPIPAEDVDPDGEALKVRHQEEPGEDHLAGATSQADAIGVIDARHWRPSSRASTLPASAIWVPTQRSGEGDTTMKMTWIISWRGLDEEFPNAADAMDRQDQLEARGIRAEMFEVVAGSRRRIA